MSTCGSTAPPGPGGLPGLWGRSSPRSTRSRSSATSATSGSGRGSAAPTRWSVRACAPGRVPQPGWCGHDPARQPRLLAGRILLDAGPGSPRGPLELVCTVSAFAWSTATGSSRGRGWKAGWRAGAFSGFSRLCPIPWLRCSIACSSRPTNAAAGESSSATTITPPVHRELPRRGRPRVDRPCPHTARRAESNPRLIVPGGWHVQSSYVKVDGSGAVSRRTDDALISR